MTDNKNKPLTLEVRRIIETGIRNGSKKAAPDIPTAASTNILMTFKTYSKTRAMEAWKAMQRIS